MPAFYGRCVVGTAGLCDAAVAADLLARWMAHRGCSARDSKGQRNEQIQILNSAQCADSGNDGQTLGPV